MNFPLRNAFMALPLEGEAKAAFLALRDALVPHEDILILHPPGTPHLTLTFWKELLQIEHDDIVRQATRVAELSGPFDLPLRGVGTFGSRGEDRILYLPPVFSPELASLKKRCPWPNEPDKPFTPHVTIARIRHANKFRIRKKKILKLLEDADLTMRADRLRLYANVNGVAQTELEEFVFASKTN